MKIFSVLLIILGLLLISSPLASPLIAQEAVKWSYSGDTGPENWGKLSPDYALCLNGTEQSPVDIISSAPLNPDNITFDYKPSALKIINNGHTIEELYDTGSSITLGGKTYQLAQFHYHLPSEHELDSKPFAMELHLVHKAADGELAVVGVWLTPGAENAAYAPVFNNMPKEEKEEPEPVSGVTINATDLLPATRTYYAYQGSLTTPPCTQGARWQVMNTSVELSQAQIDAYKVIFPLDARPVQALNGREFLVVSTLPQTGADIFAGNGIAVGLGVVFLSGGVGLLAWNRRRERIHVEEVGA